MPRKYNTRFAASSRGSRSTFDSDDDDECLLGESVNIARNDQVQNSMCSENNRDSFWCFLNKIATFIFLILLCFLFVGIYQLNREVRFIKNDYDFLRGELEMIKNVHFMIEAKQERILEDLSKLSHKDQSCPDCNITDMAVQEAIDNYDADKTGLPDFALESAGASIITTYDTKNFPRGSSLTLFGFVLCTTNKGARAILQPNVSPGECWAFKGDKGRVVIKLLKKIVVNGVTLEHISKNISPSDEITSAPKEFSVLGLEHAKDSKPHFLGEFRYQLNNRPVQYFPITNHKQSFLYVELRFLSNQGHENYTCIYRVRIHGILENN